MEGTTTRKARLRSAVALLVSAFLLAVTLATTGAPAAEAQEEPLPIVFVHGYLGSGAQYRTQAMRFQSNGWPAERIRAVDYSGLNPPDLDGFIDDVRDEFGVDQVFVAAHSLGTAVMASYLLNPAQSAKVEAYAALDGLPALCLGGTRCTSITAASMGQTHVEAAVSAESFERQYQHFTGAPPQTTDVVPEEDVEIAGKVVEFTTNNPVQAAGELWAIDPETGQRTGGGPEATFNTAADGSFAPIPVEEGQPYEIEVNDPTGTVHYYYQPFERTSHILRLQYPPASVRDNTNTGDHVAGVVLRYREWGGSDTIEVTTGDQGPVDIMSAVGGNPVGIHIHDDVATPGQTSLAELPYFSTQPFQTGVDVFMPGGLPPDGTVSFVSAPRGDTGNLQEINVPNWASEAQPGGEFHGILVEFNDYF